MAYAWTCPFCDKGSIVTEANYFEDRTWLSKENLHGKRMVQLQFIICPNPECKEFTLIASMFKYRSSGGGSTVGERVKEWRLIPPSSAKSFPSYIPKPILDDYVEACLVRELSPKASATLSRRCLQGMIRDFWNVRKGRLIDEINGLRALVDPLTWSAIDAVRSVGNVGAHMEKDIDLIVEVDPDEAAKLIGLIELLIRDWYILRHERQKNLEEIVKIGEEKAAAKQGAENNKEE